MPQAAVAALLGRDRDLRDVAGKLGVSFHTARRHLADLVAKTETHFQSQLVHLLSGLKHTPSDAHGPHDRLRRR